ncbi:MAG: glycine--tRNA ligase subunit beta [Gammaproteobacteria bacterium]|nr:glycine--tRNA ligase subunit beta [Gammaproteobacteria bacterium]
MSAKTKQKTADFLVEIHTEELPPKSLSRLAKSFLNEIETRLQKAPLEFGHAEFFASPRRLAVLVSDLAAEQPATTVERRGPAIAAAFDSNKNPTPACVGFAKSCGVTPDQLITLNNAQGEWVGYQQVIPGKSVQELMPVIVLEALAALPVAKRMRWGNNTVEFVRPISSVIMLYGNDVIDANILGFKTDRITSGHRAHGQKNISITSPKKYLEILETKGYVIADFERRKKMISDQITNIVKKKLGDNAKALVSDVLLDEVTGLVEWPVAVLGNFEERFLEVPREALISAMQDHQRYFPVVDKDGKLLPHFVTISNIESTHPKSVVAGNERVLRARLSDAAFFFMTDKKRSLESHLENLKQVVFQNKLGTLFDKAQRVSELSKFIANAISENANEAARAGLLAKADLTTEMVGEFPELQGIAGYYYAQHDKESLPVAIAIKEHYMPRFSGDALPQTQLGLIVAMADRLDTLVGIFGINQIPTGDKDPFALRRAALGVLRILIENKIDLDLKVLLEAAKKQYQVPLDNIAVVEQVLSFMLDRLKPWYQELDISPDVFAAVTALNITRPYDIHRRIQAVNDFKKLPEAEALCAANKRVSNILAKLEKPIIAKEIDTRLFENDAEQELAKQLLMKSESLKSVYQNANYVEMLSQLAELRAPVDNFFEKVMVMAEDSHQRENRLLMLSQLRALFLQVADVALLVVQK